MPSARHCLLSARPAPGSARGTWAQQESERCALASVVTTVIQLPTCWPAVASGLDTGSQGDEGFCPHGAHRGRKQTWAQRNEGSGTHSSNSLLSLHLTAGLGQPCVPLSGFSLQTVDLAAALLCSEVA